MSETILYRGDLFYKYSILIILIVSILIVNDVSESAGINLHESEVRVVYAMPFNFSEYSVYSADSYASEQWLSAVMNGLYKRSMSADRNWVPDLAASMPVISLDKKTFTVNLKLNLIFSNGEPLTADDVVFSFKVAMTPAINSNFYGGYIGFMNNDSVVKIDRDTVEITLFQTFAFPFTLLSTPLIPEETFGDLYDSCLGGTLKDCVWDNEDLSFAIAAGPYKGSSFDEVNQAITVVKNENYWGWIDGSVSGNVDTIVFKSTELKAKAIAELVEGQVDIIDSNYAIDIDQIAWFKGVTDVFADVSSHQELSLNHLHPMYGTGKGLPGISTSSDTDTWGAALKVRKAMSHIMDREFIADQINNGLAVPAATSMPRASIGYDLTIPYRDYNLNRAKDFMEQAGFDYNTLTDADNDGVYETFFFTITVLSPNTNPARNEWSSNYVLELPKIGIGVKEHISTGWAEIIPRTFGFTGTGETLVPLYDDEGYDVLFVGYGWGAFDWNPQGLYECRGRHDSGCGGNFYNFDVDQIQTDIGPLVTEYLSELDFTLRNEKVKLLQWELHETLPIIPIIYPISQWGFSDALSGYDALLLSKSSMEWDLLRNVQSELILTQALTEPQPSVFSQVSTIQSSVPFDTPSTTSYQASFLPIFSSILVLIPLLVLFNRKQNQII